MEPHRWDHADGTAHMEPHMEPRVDRATGLAKSDFWLTTRLSSYAQNNVPNEVQYEQSIDDAYAGFCALTLCLFRGGVDISTRQSKQKENMDRKNSS